MFLPTETTSSGQKHQVATTKSKLESQGNEKLPDMELMTPKKGDKLLVFQHDPFNRRGQS